MRKGFTLIELLVIICIIAIVFALIFAAVTSINTTSENKAGLTSPSTERLEVVDGPLEIGACDLYILRDKQTEIEFVLATDNFDYAALMSLRGSDER